MNAKKTAAAFCMLAASVAVNAQTSDGLNELSAARKPHLEAGLRAGGYVSLERSGGFTDRNNLHGGLGGAFVRLRSGRQHRFGLELAAYHGATERSFAQVYDWMVMQPSSTTAGFRKRSTDIALQAQVHPGRDGQNVRPYAGVGIGATWNQYFSESKVLESQLNGFNLYSPIEPLLQIEQGMNWKIAERCFLSQSLYYRYEMESGISNVGIRFGAFVSL